MLDSLKEAGKSIGRELNRAWESLSDGWRELISRCSNALVHFDRAEQDNESDTCIGAETSNDRSKRQCSTKV